jgi:hypothetical protein
MTCQQTQIYKLHGKHAIIKYIHYEKNHGHLPIIAKLNIGKPIMIISKTLSHTFH